MKYVRRHILIFFLLLGTNLLWFPSLSLAVNPDSNSGENSVPEGATTIKERSDLRWVIYDRGDQTDWLKVSPRNNVDQQMIIFIDFVTV